MTKMVFPMILAYIQMFEIIYLAVDHKESYFIFLCQSRSVASVYKYTFFLISKEKIGWRIKISIGLHLRACVGFC